MADRVVRADVDVKAIPLFAQQAGNDKVFAFLGVALLAMFENGIDAGANILRCSMASPLNGTGYREPVCDVPVRKDVRGKPQAERRKHANGEFIEQESDDHTLERVQAVYD